MMARVLAAMVQFLFQVVEDKVRPVEHRRQAYSTVPDDWLWAGRSERATAGRQGTG